MSNAAPALSALNMALSFALELAMLLALGLWAWSAAEGVWRYLGVAAIVVVAIGLWGVLAAPNAATRLPMPWLLLFKIAMFGAAAAGLWAADRPLWAGIFGALVVLNIALTAAFGTW